MNQQEVFNIVAEHLLSQNARSENLAKHCLYRGPDGRRCAIGILIPDEKYTGELEGLPLSSSKVINSLSYLCITSPDILILKKLQNIHDHYNPGQWYFCLKYFAEKYKLEFKF